MDPLNIQNDISKSALASGGTVMVFDAAKFKSSGNSEFRYTIVQAPLMVERHARYHWKELIETFMKN